eukprot:4730233-Pleurochrysis_carterae.AAC.1
MDAHARHARTHARRHGRASARHGAAAFEQRCSSGCPPLSCSACLANTVRSLWAICLSSVAVFIDAASWWGHSLLVAAPFPVRSALVFYTNPCSF